MIGEEGTPLERNLSAMLLVLIRAVESGNRTNIEKKIKDAKGLLVRSGRCSPLRQEGERFQRVSVTERGGVTRVVYRRPLRVEFEE